jgi:O-antigen ligase
MERTNPYLNNIAYFFLMVFAFVLMLSNALAEFMAALMLMIWIAQTLVYRRREWLNYPLFKPIAALIGFKFLVLISSGYDGKFGSVFEQLTLPLLYFIVPSIVVNSERRQKIIWLLIAGAILAAGIGIIKYSAGIDVRAESLVSGTYTLSIYLVFVLGLVLSMFVFTKNTVEKLFLALVTLPLVVGVVFTLTRICYAALGLYVLLLGIFKDRKLLIIVAAIAAIIYFYSPATLDAINRRFDYNNKKQFYSYRDDVFNLAKLKIKEVGFFGNGINSFLELAVDSDSPDLRNKKLGSWHSMYYEYLFDGGPFALLILFWILFTQIRYSLARYRKSKDSEQKIFQLGILLMVLGIFVVGIFADLLRGPIISMLVWMMLGLSLI